MTLLLEYCGTTEVQFCFTHKTPYNSMSVNRVCTKIGTEFGLWTTKTCSKFQLNQNVCCK